MLPGFDTPKNLLIGSRHFSLSFQVDRIFPVNIQAYLDNQRSRVDGFLEKALPPEGVEPVVLYQSMAYSLLGGGKRIRPIVTIASAQALGYDKDDMLPFAAALEFVHTYSLIHHGIGNSCAPFRSWTLVDWSKRRFLLEVLDFRRSPFGLHAGADLVGFPPILPRTST